MSGIRREKVNNIAILKIDRPEAYNALSREIVNEIDNYAEEIKKDKSIKVLIIHSDHHFAAGADIKGMVDCSEEKAKEFAFSNTFNKLANLDIPTIAAIEGYALGGGLELALTCDLRIASADAKLGFPEITLGIMPGAGGTIRTPRMISPAKAKELIFLGESIKAVKAQEMGLVNIVAEKEEVFPLAMKWAKKLSKLPTIALAAAKKSIDQGLEEQDISKAIAMESIRWAKLFNTDDQKEGMMAFLEKRKPVYKGK
jgi:enoyl-CoA hydratase/carnithine racemase